MNDRCKRNRVYAHLQRKCRYSFRYELTLFPLEQFDSSVGSMRRYLYLRSISCQNRRVSWINKLSPFLFTCPKILYIYYEIYKNCKEKYYVCKIVSTFKKFHRKSNCRVVVVFRAEKKGKKRIDLILKILIFKFFQLNPVYCFLYLLSYRHIHFLIIFRDVQFRDAISISVPFVERMSFPSSLSPCKRNQKSEIIYFGGRDRGGGKERTMRVNTIVHLEGAAASTLFCRLAKEPSSELMAPNASFIRMENEKTRASLITATRKDRGGKIRLSRKDVSPVE